MLARSLSRVEEAEEKVLADAADLYEGVPIKPWTPETASDAVPGARRVAPSNAMTAATSAVKAAVPQVIYLEKKPKLSFGGTAPPEGAGGGLVKADSPPPDGEAARRDAIAAALAKANAGGAAAVSGGAAPAPAGGAAPAPAYASAPAPAYASAPPAPAGGAAPAPAFNTAYASAPRGREAMAQAAAHAAQQRALKAAQEEAAKKAAEDAAAARKVEEQIALTRAAAAGFRGPPVPPKEVLHARAAVMPSQPTAAPAAPPPAAPPPAAPPPAAPQPAAAPLAPLVAVPQFQKEKKEKSPARGLPAWAQGGMQY